MGRLTGIAHFFTAKAWEEEKQDTRDLCQQKEAPEDSDILEGNESESIKLLQVKIARCMHDAFDGHIICCTARSLNWMGSLLIDLPPCNIVHAYLDLTEHEKRIIDTRLLALKEECISPDMCDLCILC